MENDAVNTTLNYFYGNDWLFSQQDVAVLCQEL